MNSLRSFALLATIAALTGCSALAQQKASPSENAALRYWAAFAQMQDSAITDEDAKKLNSILDGTAPYDDLEYKDLVEKNRPALETMARATGLPNCDWGLDYEMGPDTPVDYVRKALVLGRLNVLYAFHLLISGDKEKAMSVLASGVRFSHDIANGGTLFATLVAKSLLVAHLQTMEFALHVEGLSNAQRKVLLKALAPLGPNGLDWQSAVKREMIVLYKVDPHDSAVAAQITPAYLRALDNPSTLPTLERMRSSAPPQLASLIPNPGHVLQAKQELAGKLQEVRSKLQ
jgi:hypothetical protein